MINQGAVVESPAAGPREPDRRSLLVLVLLFLFAALYFSLTPFNSVDCWWHMRGAEYFWHHGQAVLNDPIAIPGDGPLLALYPDLFPGTLFWLAYAAGSFLGLNLLRIAVFMALLVLLARAACQRRSDPLPLLCASALLVLAMAGMVALRPDLFNYPFFVLWLVLLDRARRRPGQLGTLAALAAVEILWANSHPLFFYYGLALGILSLSFISGREKIRLPWPGKREVHAPIRALYLATVGLSWLANPLGWRALLGLPVNTIRVDYAPGSMRSLPAALASVNTYLFFLIVLLLLAGRPWRRRADRVWFFAALVLMLLPALLYQRALPFVPIFLIVASAQVPAAASRTRKRRLWPQLLLAGLCLFLVLERQYLLSPRLVGWINRQCRTNMAEEFLPAGIGLFSVLPGEQVREVGILKGLGVRGNFVSNHLGLCSAVTWLDRDVRPYWYGHAALINARSADLRSFLIALERREGKTVERFLDVYRIEVVALTNYTARFLDDPGRFLDQLTPVYLDPQFSVWVRRGTRPAEGR